MKHWLKVVWICIAVAFLAGVAITGATIAFNGGRLTSVYIDGGGLHTSRNEGEPVVFSESDLEAFTDIDIGLVGATVNLVESDSYGYEITAYNPDDVQISMAGGFLSIREDSPRFSLGFTLGIFNPKQMRQNVTVFLPSGSKLERLRVQTVSSDTNLSVRGLKIEQLDYETVSGNFANFDHETTSGAAPSGAAALAPAKPSGQGLQVGQLNVKAVSGQISFIGTVSSKIGVDLVSGNAYLDLQGSADDYRLSLEKVSGTVYINGEALGESDQWPIGVWRSGSSDAARQIDVHLISGDVNLHFSD